jgi:hypothetical protein
MTSPAVVVPACMTCRDHSEEKDHASGVEDWCHSPKINSGLSPLAFDADEMSSARANGWISFKEADCLSTLSSLLPTRQGLPLGRRKSKPTRGKEEVMVKTKLPKEAEEVIRKILEFDKEYRQPYGVGYWKEKDGGWVHEGFGYDLIVNDEGAFFYSDEYETPVT